MAGLLRAQRSGYERAWYARQCSASSVTSMANETVEVTLPGDPQGPPTWPGRSTISGGDIEEVIPDPIPNSEVKLFGADGTARET